MLNSEQIRAVSIIDGPLLILAGAGSGKTHTLTERVYSMIHEVGIAPTSILCVTFTNKAAREMRERIAKKLGRDMPMSFGIPRDFPLVSTFHSMGVMFLRLFIDKIGYARNFSIYDEDDVRSVIKEIVDGKRIDPKDAPVRQVQYEISLAKNSGLSPDKYAHTAESHFQWIVAEIYPDYEKKMRANNALDFDDILLKTRDVLHISAVLEHFQDRFQYFCVDEYQDTNSIQYEIIQLLANKSKNLCVVGDDWQGIYSWRGANIANILNFKHDFPAAEVVKLEQNYRSSSTIINAANVVIKHNQSALDKRMWTEAEEGEKIQIHECTSEREEADKIGNFVEKNPASWAILYRTNGQSRVIEEALIRRGVPYEIVGWLKFYDRKEIKDIIAYLKVTMTPTNSVAWKRIVNTPPRKIGPTSVERIMKYVSENELDYMSLDLPRSIWNQSTLEHLEGATHIDHIPDMKSAAKWAITGFTQIMREIQNTSRELPARLLIDKVLQLIKYQEYLEENFSPPEVEAKVENINELKNLASRYDDLPPEESLMHFLEDIALITAEQNNDDGSEKVLLMTIHSAKGLEFDHVIISGAEEWIFPHSRTLFEPIQLEEERRLWYVAMTRAKKKLVITRANERYSFGTYASNIASRFVGEIPSEYTEIHVPKRLFMTDFLGTSGESTLEGDWWHIQPTEKKLWLWAQIRNMNNFSLGDRVEHKKFGVGTIVSLIGDVAQIAFASGIKSLNIRIAPLTKI